MSVIFRLTGQLAASLDYSTAQVNAPQLPGAQVGMAPEIGVAVIDSGIYSHPDLLSAQGQSRVVYRRDFIGGVQNDDFGHGTRTWRAAIRRDGRHIQCARQLACAPRDCSQCQSARSSSAGSKRFQHG